MKKYTGTKTVCAAPMTMGEACDLKLLKEGVRLSECEVDKSGYLVEYEDGRKSWCPSDVFEKEYEPSDTPIDRMEIEHKESFERYKRGLDFIHSDLFCGLEYLSKVLLSAQNETQREYCRLLAYRKKHMYKELELSNNHDFGTAVKFLKAGGAIRRSGWGRNGAFVIKQVPAQITSEVIPNMQSLPQIAKDILMKRQDPHVHYSNQMIIIHPDGTADAWLPSSSDVFAKDWELVTG